MSAFRNYFSYFICLHFFETPDGRSLHFVNINLFRPLYATPLSVSPCSMREVLCCRSLRPIRCSRGGTQGRSAYCFRSLSLNLPVRSSRLQLQDKNPLLGYTNHVPSCVATAGGWSNFLGISDLASFLDGLRRGDLCQRELFEQGIARRGALSGGIQIKY